MVQRSAPRTRAGQHLCCTRGSRFSLVFREAPVLHYRGQLRTWACKWVKKLFVAWSSVPTPWSRLDTALISLEQTPALLGPCRPFSAPGVPRPCVCCRGSVGHWTQGCRCSSDLRTGGAKEKHAVGAWALLCSPSRSLATFDLHWQTFGCYKDLPSQVLKIHIWVKSCVPRSWGAFHVLCTQKVCSGAGGLSWAPSWNDWTTFLPSQLTGDKRKMSFRLGT